MANQVRHNQHIDSPSFKEYAYRILKNITPFQKETLSASELANFQNDYTLQRFCKHERIDHILYILSKCGIEWTLRLSKEDLQYETDMVEFITQGQFTYPARRIDAIEATKREGVCVISSRDVMFTSHMVAQNCTTKVYNISEFHKDLAKKGRDFEQLKQWDKEVEKTTKAHDLFNDLILELENATEYANRSLGLDRQDIRILCALSKKRQSAITMTEMATLTKSTGRKMFFRKNMEGLLNEGLVVSDANDVKKRWANGTYFMITAKGIDRIMRFKEY